MKTCYLGRTVREAECPRALPGRVIGVKSVSLSNLRFSFSLFLFVSLSTAASLSLANLGLLPTSDGKQLWERDCIRDVHGVCAFSDSCCGLSFFVVFVVLSCRETAPLLPYNWPPLTLSFSFSGELIAELPENRGCSAAAALHPAPGGNRPLPICMSQFAPPWPAT